jgi:hypothetical protein
MVFNSAESAKLQLYSQIQNLTISISTSNALSSNWLSGSFFSGDDRDIVRDKTKTYLMAQARLLTILFFFHLHLYSLWWKSSVSFNVCSVLIARRVCGRRVRVEISTGKAPRPRGGRSGGGGSFDRRAANFNPSDRCYRCGLRGHYAYDCERSRRDRR